MKTTVDLNGTEVKPCAEIDGVSLKGKEALAMSPPSEHHGYNALPLGGIWAQARYLHNGSVPTLYHLLVLEERPERFVKSRLGYDQKQVGFIWQEAAASDDDHFAWTFDSNAFHTLSNRGHDRDITEDGKTYKLDWSDDKDGAIAIIEYMKTL